jgi:DNA-binding LytR/AlgR family response regulator
MKITESFELEDILYLEGNSNYTLFHMRCGKVHISSFTLKKFDTSQRYALFLRISRSYLINPSKINLIWDEGQHKVVKLTNGRQLKASRRRGSVLEQLNHIL